MQSNTIKKENPTNANIKKVSHKYNCVLFTDVLLHVFSKPWQ